MSLSINAMRRIDLLAGVPICFLLSILDKIKRLITRNNSSNTPTNILFIGLSEMGSMILAQPSLRKAQSISLGELYFVCFDQNSPALGLIKQIDRGNIFTIDSSSLLTLLRDTAKFFSWSRRNRIDTVVDLELFSRYSAILSWISGAVNLSGYYRFFTEGLYRGDFMTHKVIYNNHQQMAKNYLALVNALVADINETPKSKSFITDEEIFVDKVYVRESFSESVVQKLKRESSSFAHSLSRIILFNTNASDLMPLRRWPKEYYIELALSLLKNHADCFIVLIGVEAEREWNEYIVHYINSDRCINFAGMTDIDELVALFEMSTCMISNDSGPAHFASVTSLKTVVLFGPETPVLYAPIGHTVAVTAGLSCSPCVSAANHRKSPCIDNICMQSINPSRLYEIVSPLLV